MAVYRTPPKCSICGKEAKGVYKDESDLPDMLKTIGDTFLYWGKIDCDCEQKDILNTIDREFVNEQMKKLKTK